MSVLRKVKLPDILMSKLERFSGFAVGIWGGLCMTLISIFIVSILCYIVILLYCSGDSKVMGVVRFACLVGLCMVTFPLRTLWRDLVLLASGRIKGVM